MRAVIANNSGKTTGICHSGPDGDEAAVEYDPNDAVTFYVREISNIPPLTNDEETDLLRQLVDSDECNEQQENAARRLIESKLALVVTIAEQHFSSGIPMLDLIQQGNLGLMKAITSFAKHPVGEFSAHAAACIEEAIARAASDLRQSNS